MQGQLGLKIRNLDYTLTRLYAMNPIAISDLTNELLLKITFFEISPIVLIRVKFQ